MGLWDTLFPPTLCEGCKKEISSKNSVDKIQLIDIIEDQGFLYFSTYGIIVNHIYKNIKIGDDVLSILSKAIKESWRLRQPLSIVDPNQADARLQNQIRYLPNLCNDCFDKNLKEFQNKYNNAYTKMNLVQTYPANYSGNFYLDDSFSPEIVTYKMERGKNQTINKIKFMAAFHNRDIVYNITYNYGENTCTGVYAKKAKRK